MHFFPMCLIEVGTESGTSEEIDWTANRDAKLIEHSNGLRLCNSTGCISLRGRTLGI